MMRSIIEGDEEAADATVMEEAINQGVGAFVPDMMYSKLVQNYKDAATKYGEKIIREVTGFEPDFIEKNVKVPEFQRELKSQIGQRIKDMENKGLIDKEGYIQEKGYTMAALMMYTEELDRLDAQGMLGEVSHKEKSHYGGREDSSPYKRGDRYADIDVMKTVKAAIRRGHSKIIKEDLRIYERESQGNIEIIYALDASGSMKGKKIEMSKKAGIALAYKAIESKDKVGILAFGADIKEKVDPTLDFHSVLMHISKVSASKETNFGKTIDTALLMFSDANVTRHLVFITDGMPTAGEDPEKEALDAIAKAAANNITVTMIGIDLDHVSEVFMRRASEIGLGKFYGVNNVESLDAIVLQDYMSL
jgi:Mg-chelatase subunit ChlD